jgi:hypothetical protein
MFSVSAIDRAAVLLLAVVLIALGWGVFRLPAENLLVVTFTSLSSALLVDVRPFRSRLKRTLLWGCYAGAAQFLTAVSAPLPLLRLLVTTLFAYFTFLTLADRRAGCIVMLTGYLGFFAPPGFLPALGRWIDLFIGAAVILIVTALGNRGSAKAPDPPAPFPPYSRKQALILAAELGTGTFITEIFQLHQGPWIMMTMLFINMCKTPGVSEKKLALQRILAVPAGIMIGGFLLGIFYRIDQHLIWLLPFIGAAGFFVLYDEGNFFFFSIIFMITMTLFADFQAGPWHKFHFWGSFFSRSLATLLGALPELFLNLVPDEGKGKEI